MYGFCVDIDGFICVSERPCNVEYRTSDVSYSLCGSCGDESKETLMGGGLHFET
jgi:hypothetical protein